MMRKGILWMLAILCFGFSAVAQEMSFSAEASAQKVGTQDKFQIRFLMTNMSNLSNFRPPAFPGFTVLGPPAQDNNADIVVDENGRAKRVFAISVIYTLAPQKAGNFTISPARVSSNGHDVLSNSISIQVVKGSLAAPQGRQRAADDDDPFVMMDRLQQQMFQQMQRLQQQREEALKQHAFQQNSQMDRMIARDINKYCFVRVQVDKTNPYLGEQITATYKLYSRLNITAGLAGLPLLNGFWSQDFQIPYPPSPTEEIFNGDRYMVFLLKKSALFPQQTGKLTLDPAKVEGTVTYQGQIPISISSTPVTINVRALPGAGQPASFTGAVGNFTISTALDKNALSTDDAATFTFKIAGSGNLKLIGAPKITFPDGLGVFDPQIADTITSRNPAITGSKVFAYSMNPQTPGDYVIPAITFSYYDVATGAYREEKTAPLKIHVTKGKNYTTESARAQSLPGDIHDIYKTGIRFENETSLVRSFWYWLWYMVGIIAVALLLMLHKQREVYAGNQALFKNKKANKEAWKRLATARKLLPQQEHKAFYEEISKAVWLYLSDKLGIPLSRLSKDTISMELESKNVPVAQIDRVKRLVLECEMALYSPSGGQQQRQHTLDEAAGTIGELETVLRNKNNVLQHAG